MIPTWKILSSRLRVSDLDRSVAFYTGALGLVARAATGGGMDLHAGGDVRPLITLVSHPGARPKPQGAPGLFHLALLVPQRADLARVLRRLAATETELQGMSDHGVSEAIYLADPDGNGLELYADRPRTAWPQNKDGSLAMFTERLDVASLLASAPESLPAALPSRTTIGHVHLRVGSLAAAEAFYVGQLGLSVTTRAYPGALFMATDGYHHHVGANIWGRSEPSSPAYAGLESLTISRVSAATPATLTDPDGLRIVVAPATEN